jgi:hypothetical protein
MSTDRLGEALGLKGDKAGAQAAYGKALSLAKDPVQKEADRGRDRQAEVGAPSASAIVPRWNETARPDVHLR